MCKLIEFFKVLALSCLLFVHNVYCRSINYNPYSYYVNSQTSIYQPFYPIGYSSQYPVPLGYGYQAPLYPPVYNPPGAYYDRLQGTYRPFPGGGRPVHVDYKHRCSDNYMGIKPHPAQMNYYYVCQPNCIIYSRCQNPQTFDPQSGHCIAQPTYNPIQPICTQPGRFPDPNDCKMYYTCDNHLAAYYFRCPDNFIYSAAVAKCVPGDSCPPTQIVESSNVPAMQENQFPSCMQNGTYRCNFDCSLYYTCEQQPNGVYRQTRFKCPGEMYFDTVSRTCCSPSVVSCDYVKVAERVYPRRQPPPAKSIECSAEQPCIEDDTIESENVEDSTSSDDEVGIASLVLNIPEDDVSTTEEQTQPSPSTPTNESSSSALTTAVTQPSESTSSTSSQPTESSTSTATPSTPTTESPSTTSETQENTWSESSPETSPNTSTEITSSETPTDSTSSPSSTSTNSTPEPSTGTTNTDAPSTTDTDDMTSSESSSEPIWDTSTESSTDTSIVSSTSTISSSESVETTSVESTWETSAETTSTEITSSSQTASTSSTPTPTTEETTIPSTSGPTTTESTWQTSSDSSTETTSTEVISSTSTVDTSSTPPPTSSTDTSTPSTSESTWETSPDSSTEITSSSQTTDTSSTQTPTSSTDTSTTPTTVSSTLETETTTSSETTWETTSTEVTSSEVTSTEISSSSQTTDITSTPPPTSSTDSSTPTSSVPSTLQTEETTSSETTWETSSDASTEVTSTEVTSTEISSSSQTTDITSTPPPTSSTDSSTPTSTLQTEETTSSESTWETSLDSSTETLSTEIPTSTSPDSTSSSEPITTSTEPSTSPTTETTSTNVPTTTSEPTTVTTTTVSFTESSTERETSPKTTTTTTKDCTIHSDTLQTGCNTPTQEINDLQQNKIYSTSEFDESYDEASVLSNEVDLGDSNVLNQKPPIIPIEPDDNFPPFTLSREDESSFSSQSESIEDEEANMIEKRQTNGIQKIPLHTSEPLLTTHTRPMLPPLLESITFRPIIHVTTNAPEFIPTTTLRTTPTTTPTTTPIPQTTIDTLTPITTPSPQTQNTPTIYNTLSTTPTPKISPTTSSHTAFNFEMNSQEDNEIDFSGYDSFENDESEGKPKRHINHINDTENWNESNEFQNGSNDLDDSFSSSEESQNENEVDDDDDEEKSQMSTEAVNKTATPNKNIDSKESLENVIKPIKMETQSRESPVSISSQSIEFAFMTTTQPPFQENQITTSKLLLPTTSESPKALDRNHIEESEIETTTAAPLRTTTEISLIEDGNGSAEKFKSLAKSLVFEPTTEPFAQSTTESTKNDTENSEDEFSESYEEDESVYNSMEATIAPTTISPPWQTTETNNESSNVSSEEKLNDDDEEDDDMWANESNEVLVRQTSNSFFNPITEPTEAPTTSSTQLAMTTEKEVFPNTTELPTTTPTTSPTTPTTTPTTTSPTTEPTTTPTSRESLENSEGESFESSEEKEILNNSIESLHTPTTSTPRIFTTTTTPTPPANKIETESRNEDLAKLKKLEHSNEAALFMSHSLVAQNIEPHENVDDEKIISAKQQQNNLVESLISAGNDIDGKAHESVNHKNLMQIESNELDEPLEEDSESQSFEEEIYDVNRSIETSLDRPMATPLTPTSQPINKISHFDSNEKFDVDKDLTTTTLNSTITAETTDMPQPNFEKSLTTTTETAMPSNEDMEYAGSESFENYVEFEPFSEPFDTRILSLPTTQIPDTTTTTRTTTTMPQISDSSVEDDAIHSEITKPNKITSTTTTTQNPIDKTTNTATQEIVNKSEHADSAAQHNINNNNIAYPLSSSKWKMQIENDTIHILSLRNHDDNVHNIENINPVNNVNSSIAPTTTKTTPKCNKKDSDKVPELVLRIFQPLDLRIIYCPKDCKKEHVHKTNPKDGAHPHAPTQPQPGKPAACQGDACEQEHDRTVDVVFKPTHLSDTARFEVQNTRPKHIDANCKH